MATWSYVHALRGEHVDYLKGQGVLLPGLSSSNRAPSEEEVTAAYAAIGSPAELVVDAYGSSSDLCVALRGSTRHALRFLIALAQRCGQLYLFPFPHDHMPGIVVDPADDLAAVLRRMDGETRHAFDESGG